MRYQAVLFDFDYTLGDATDAIVAGYTHALTTLGHPTPAREEVRKTVGMMVEDGYTYLSGDPSPEHRARCRALFSEIARPMQAKGVPLFPGALELLRALHGSGVGMAVVSSKHGPTLGAILAEHGLEDAFAAVLGSDVVKSPKPDPEGLLRALSTLGVPPEKALFCGDTVIDAEAAQRAGTDFCAVLNGTTPEEAFASYPHVHIAPDLADLKGWLEV